MYLRRCIFIAFFLCFPLAGNTCTCIGSNSTKEEVERCDVVVIVKIISYEYVKYCDTLNKFKYDTGFLYDVFSVERIRYRVEMSRVVKGSFSRRTIEIISGKGNGDCGVRFELGKKYIVYANWKTKLANDEPERPSFLYTDNCYRTQIYSKKELDNLGHVVKRR